MLHYVTHIHIYTNDIGFVWPLTYLCRSPRGRYVYNMASLETQQSPSVVLRINQEMGTKLKEKQASAINACRTSDVLGFLPTGYGKTSSNQSRNWDKVYKVKGKAGFSNKCLQFQWCFGSVTLGVGRLSSFRWESRASSTLAGVGLVRPWQYSIFFLYSFAYYM